MSAAPLTAYAVSPARRRRDRLARGAVVAASFVAMIPLALILYYLLRKGLGAISWNFLTSDPSGNTFFGAANIGGIRSALVGTIMIVGLATLIAVPIGLAVALWLVEYGRQSPMARAVRFFVDILTGVPAIVFGLFIYILLVVGTGYAGYKGSLALVLLMLPIVIRSAEVVFELVPNELRESALALGSPRWGVVARVVIPTAMPGLITGVLLAVARAAGETAPLLFTAGSTMKTTTNLNSFMNSLPVQIYNDVTSPTPSVVERAWGTALTLVILILMLNLAARLVAHRSKIG